MGGNKLIMLAMLALALVLVLTLGLCLCVYLMPQQAAAGFVRLDRYNAGLTQKEIVLPDGLHYVYLEGGQGEPLILLHGFAAEKDHFARIAKFLTPHYHVIIPDLLGFGESSHPAQVGQGAAVDYSAGAQAERVRALALALGLKSVHLGGNSMGGQIALAYAAAHPAEVDSLWLLSPAGIWSAPQSELAKMIEQGQRNILLIHNADEFAQAYDFVMSRPPLVPRPILNALAQHAISNEPLSERIFTQITSDSLEKSITGLKTPTLIVWGDQDRVLNVMTAEILNSMMPRSEVIQMKGIGHIPMLEAPAQAAEDYIRFRSEKVVP